LPQAIPEKNDDDELDVAAAKESIRIAVTEIMDGNHFYYQVLGKRTSLLP
jgi:hypothetical protein